MKKIAVPTRNDIVDDHFGHCESYTIFTVGNDNRIEKTEVLLSPPGCGCKSNIAEILRDRQVNLMLAGNMGLGAYNVLTHHGIDVVRGCKGNIHTIVRAYLDGSITDTQVHCGEHHHHHHQHHHGTE